MRERRECVYECCACVCERHAYVARAQMPDPRFDGLEAVATDVEETRRLWDTYKDYSAELVAIRGQDWITFRARIFELQDFSAKWVDAVKGKTKDAVRERLSSQPRAPARRPPALPQPYVHA